MLNLCWSLLPKTCSGGPDYLPACPCKGLCRNDSKSRGRVCPQRADDSHRSGNPIQGHPIRPAKRWCHAASGILYAQCYGIFGGGDLMESWQWVRHSRWTLFGVVRASQGILLANNHKMQMKLNSLLYLQCFVVFCRGVLNPWPIPFGFYKTQMAHTWLPWPFWDPPKSWSWEEAHWRQWRGQKGCRACTVAISAYSRCMRIYIDVWYDCRIGFFVVTRDGWWWLEPPLTDHSFTGFNCGLETEAKLLWWLLEHTPLSGAMLYWAAHKINKNIAKWTLQDWGLWPLCRLTRPLHPAVAQ